MSAFEVGDVVEVDCANPHREFRVLGLFDETGGHNIVLVDTWLERGVPFFANTVSYRKVVEKFEVGKWYEYNDSVLTANKWFASWMFDGWVGGYVVDSEGKFNRTWYVSETTRNEFTEVEG